MRDDRLTIRCHFCQKEIHYRVLKKWYKKYIVNSIDLGGTRVKTYPTYMFGVVRLNDHDVGILRKHTCEGSGRKFKMKIE
jgi:hypothetical protein